jgi:hypothetical protein
VQAGKYLLKCGCDAIGIRIQFLLLACSHLTAVFLFHSGRSNPPPRHSPPTSAAPQPSKPDSSNSGTPARAANTAAAGSAAARLGSRPRLFRHRRLSSCVVLRIRFDGIFFRQDGAACPTKHTIPATTGPPTSERREEDLGPFFPVPSSQVAALPLGASGLQQLGGGRSSPLNIITLF